MRERLAAYSRELGVGKLIAMLQIATLPADLTEKNLRLFARDVMPYLREQGTRAPTARSPRQRCHEQKSLWLSSSRMRDDLAIAEIDDWHGAAAFDFGDYWMPAYAGMTRIGRTRPRDSKRRREAMGRRGLLVLLAAIVGCAVSPALAADTLKIASPIRGSWEGAIPELGKQAGIFQKHGLDLEILYTQGGGETLQVVVSGAVDVGLAPACSAAWALTPRARPFASSAASSTGSREVFWWVPAKSPLHSMREANGQTIAYSTVGASSHIDVLRFISEYGLKAPAGRDRRRAATITQTMSGQVDVGWSVAPFVLDSLDKGEIRIIARASELAAPRGQTIRVQITNARESWRRRRTRFARYMKAYNETVDWMYSSPDAVPRYIAFSGLSETSVRHMLQRLHPEGEPADRKDLTGLASSVKDAVQFKFLRRRSTTVSSSS